VFYLGTGSWSFDLTSIFFRLGSALHSVLSSLHLGAVLLVLCTIVGLVNIVPCDIIYITQQGADVKLPDDDTEMSKHVAVYII
jgi:hypothetical protein